VVKRYFTTSNKGITQNQRLYLYLKYGNITNKEDKMAITLEEAKRLQHGTILYYTKACNADGTPQRYRVAGTPKTWKTMPEKVEVPLKYGLKTWARLTENHLEHFCLHEWEAYGEKYRFRKIGKNEYILLFRQKTWIISKNEKGFWQNRELNNYYSLPEGAGQRTRKECAVQILRYLL
jgi:hypothetical protein